MPPPSKGKTTKRKTIPIVFPNWKESRAYPAEQPLTCAGYGCHRTICVGEYYTKHKPQAASYYYSLHAFCRTCIPFTEVQRTSRELSEEYLSTPLEKADRKALGYEV